jgi:dolichol-phosphate mannosyltransferase
MNRPYISVITPVYGCDACLDELHQRLTRVIQELTDKYEIVMINDGSPDASWAKIILLSQNDKKVRGIRLSRNFGQHKAITAGLDYARGDWVVVMDCDLQDPPEEIPKLYHEAVKGYDIVFGRRERRKDAYFKRLASKLFYKIYDYFTESKVDNTVANFSIISSAVVEKLRLLKEQDRAYPLFVNWVGFKRSNVNIIHAKRNSGRSSYTVRKLINLAIDSIVSQSNKPLRMSIKFGFLLSVFSLFYALWLIIRYFIYSVPVEGWTSVMVSIYFIGGLLFANMGILGLYIGKIYDEAKKRPLYIVQETTFDG